MKATKYILLCILIILLFNGCGSPEYQINYYNTQSQNNLIETDDYYIYRKDEYYVYNKATTEEYPLLDNPLKNENDYNFISKIKSCSNTLFFMYKDENSQYTIESLNLDSGKREILYVDPIYGEKVSLFDIEISKQSPLQYDNMGYELIDFMLFENNIVLIRRDTISKLQNNKEVPIYEGYFDKLANDSEHIYFTNEKFNLCSINVAEGTKKEYDTIKPWQYFIYENSIYYISQADNSFIISDIKLNKILHEYTGDWKKIIFEKGNFLLKDKNNDIFYLSNDSSFKQLEINHDYDEITITKNGKQLILFKYDIMNFSEIEFVNLSDLQSQSNSK